jgi:YggT family protein
MGNILQTIIVTLGQGLTILIIIDSLLSFVMSPVHPVREALGRILQPLYAPIRRIMPQMGMFDFSPIVLLLLIQLVVRLLTSII